MKQASPSMPDLKGLEIVDSKSHRSYTYT